MKNMGGRRRKPHGAQATLTDVARAAAVSTASASRALARPAAVSDALRVRVSEAVNRLGYVPNSAARALVRRRSGMIGVIAGALDEPGMAVALAALDARLTDAGWALLLSGGGQGTPQAGAHALASHGVEALVFLGVDVPAGFGQLRGIQRLPCVSVDRTDASGFIASGGLDLARAGRLVVEYLEQLGHRRLAVVVDTHSVIGALLVDAALRSGKVSPGSSAELLNTGDGPVAEGIVKWLALPEPPTAAICGSDAIAVAVMHACTCHGIEVPGQFSVVGFGDTPLARRVLPMLTSVRIPAQSAGIAAAEYLLARLAGKAADFPELPIKLAVRGSTGPPIGF